MFGEKRDRIVSAWRDFQRTKFYDIVIALPLIALYGSSAFHLVPSLMDRLSKADPHSIDFVFAVSVLAQTGAIILILLALTFLLIRKPPKAKAKGLLPRFAAVAGTYLGVVVVWLPQRPMGVSLSLASLFLMTAGVGFAIYALAHLGRSFSLMAEARHLVTDGPYASIRHPLYLGEAMSMIGLMLQYLSPLALLIVALQLSFQLMRMKNEEAVLADLFPEYEAYKVRTARLVPGVY